MYGYTLFTLTLHDRVHVSPLIQREPTESTTFEGSNPRCVGHGYIHPVGLGNECTSRYTKHISHANHFPLFTKSK